MCSSGMAVLMLTASNTSTPLMIGVCGLSLGLATGFFWANGGLLAIATTTDEDRNYFQGVETAAFTFASVVVPWIVGFIITSSQTLHSPNSQAPAGYKTVAVVSVILTGTAAGIVVGGRFKTTSISDFLFFRFHRLWYRLLLLAGLRGVTQGFIVTAPAVLILRMVGHEGTLGRIEAIGGVIAAICAYWIGRRSSPRHRVWILSAGVVTFCLGSLASGTLYNAAGTVIFIACLILAKPLIELAYVPIQFRTIDVLSAIEGRNFYTYLMSHEMGVLAGRILGCGLFLLIGIGVSETAAVRYALPIVATLQLPAILVARDLPL